MSRFVIVTFGKRSISLATATAVEYFQYAIYSCGQFFLELAHPPVKCYHKQLNNFVCKVNI